MKIARIDTIRLDIPFDDGGTGLGMTPSAWNQLDMVLVRIKTDTGLVGWGEAFSYFCAGAVKSMLDDTIIPMLIGKDATDPQAISMLLQQKLVLFGRYGITIFALSGIDIALWDLKAKAAGKPLAELIGGMRRGSVPAYASLVRYGDPKIAARFTAQALAEGYDYIKLHEVTREAIGACNDARGKAELMVDVNCNWPEPEAQDMAAWLGSIGTLWLEEPTFPPEDYAQMGRLSDKVPISAGENLCTAWQFEALIASGGVKYPQPSVTKVGGISEMLKIMKAADAADHAHLMPHSPYFGPGYLATLQIAAALLDEPLFEYLYIWPEAWLYTETPKPVAGRVAIPQGVGLGFEPDPEMIAKYRVG
ncbi:mandelate racemase/muconate lactonizing enzyme family protein [Falsirhodobacter xinxiangensis]|uniref:mandelate racemase/muconate lactonizing enzyme family protein n=1 Tax=Falsirhodobacter xinxiangensis TaxID=2530049 RepID=UPI0010AACA82|nr:mandelate racemase/muconate lactonizing enzyme family protein [Rhodobacter xinxiangensis]